MTTIQPSVTGRAAYSIVEVCARTGLGRDIVYTAIRSGRLIARKLGRRTLITERDLQRFLESLPKATKLREATPLRGTNS
jgi:excisionase family DNA binding protein